MEYKVLLKKKVRKKLNALPVNPRERLYALVQLLREFGPTAPHSWPNYNKLRGDGERYHCHLTGDHAWVACWSFEKDTLTIEVYYAGSHQKAPY